MNDINGFFKNIENLFAKSDITKQQIVDAIKLFIPNFEHIETGKNLDQKM
jgi:hypothetical protein